MLKMDFRKCHECIKAYWLSKCDRWTECRHLVNFFRFYGQKTRRMWSDPRCRLSRMAGLKSSTLALLVAEELTAWEALLFNDAWVFLGTQCFHTEILVIPVTRREPQLGAEYRGREEPETKLRRFQRTDKSKYHLRTSYLTCKLLVISRATKFECK